MFPVRFFCNRMYAPRYFAKVGGAAVFKIAWALNSNRTVGMNVEPE